MLYPNALLKTFTSYRSVKVSYGTIQYFQQPVEVGSWQKFANFEIFVLKEVEGFPDHQNICGNKQKYFYVDRKICFEK
jgi:hypothetical protein